MIRLQTRERIYLYWQYPASFTAHAFPPYRMSGSFHLLALFRSYIRNAQCETGRETGYCSLLLITNDGYFPPSFLFQA